jgi:hypothetical protein
MKDAIGKDGYQVSRHPDIEKIEDRKIGKAYCSNLRKRVEAYLTAASQLFKVYKKHGGGGGSEKDFIKEC